MIFHEHKKGSQRFRMLTNEQGKAIGWTPQQAFKDYTPTEEEALAMDSILPPSVNSNKKETGKNTLSIAFFKSAVGSPTLNLQMSQFHGFVISIS